MDLSFSPIIDSYPIAMSLWFGSIVGVFVWSLYLSDNELVTTQTIIKMRIYSIYSTLFFVFLFAAWGTTSFIMPCNLTWTLMVLWFMAIVWCSFKEIDVFFKYLDEKYPDPGLPTLLGTFIILNSTAFVLTFATLIA